MLYCRAPVLGPVVVCAALWASACNNSPVSSVSPTSPTPTAIANSDNAPDGPAAVPPDGSPNEPPPVVGSGSAVLVGAGDIGWCGSSGVAATARLIDRIPGHVFLAGDNAYLKATMDDYRRCLDPEWGRFRSRWRPVPGNHEYETPGADGYFTYFGGDAGPGRQGYYGFRAATWHVLMLNSMAPAARGSAQYEWAREELRHNRTRCTMAVWHHPFASSGPNGPTAYMRDLWQLLNESGAELVVSGHDHLYERFAPQDQDYQHNARGVRQFIAGTGGAPIYRPARHAPNTEAIVQAHGVLKLTLHPTVYEWEFLEASSGNRIDVGSTVCH